MRHRVIEPTTDMTVTPTGGDNYEVNLSLPVDRDGTIGRECPDDGCVPRYFKVKPGTGIVGQVSKMTCPYCARTEEPNAFTTDEQRRYALEYVEREAFRGMTAMLGEALGVEPGGRRSFGGGLFTMELSMDPIQLPAVQRPIEERLRHDVTCPGCGLEHAVFGLAFWCPDCGTDLFGVHVDLELGSIADALADVPRREELLGERGAARDLNNSLEDAVTLMEAALKAITVGVLRARGATNETVADTLQRRVRNTFQNPAAGARLLADLFGFDLLRALSATEKDELIELVEMRHPIAHNMGVGDRQYERRTGAHGAAGRDLSVTAASVSRALELIKRIVVDVRAQSLPSPAGDPGEH